MDTQSVLLVEDDFIIAMAAQEQLSDKGFTVYGPIAREQDAIDCAREVDPTYAILDVRLALGSGLVVAEHIMAKGRTRILYATAHCNDLRLAPKHGPSLCIMKPYKAEDLPRALGLVDRLAEGEIMPDPLPPNLLVVRGSHGGTAIF